VVISLDIGEWLFSLYIGEWLVSRSGRCSLGKDPGYRSTWAPAVVCDVLDERKSLFLLFLFILLGLCFLPEDGAPLFEEPVN
jgi:hypothetical protein